MPSTERAATAELSMPQMAHAASERLNGSRIFNTLAVIIDFTNAREEQTRRVKLCPLLVGLPSGVHVYIRCRRDKGFSYNLF